MADLDLNFVASDVLDARITFSRTSLATYYGADGLLKYAAHNLVLQSQTFDHASWIITNGATVTANNTTAPDGTTTADQLNHVTAGTVPAGRINQSYSAAFYRSILSLYVKAGTKSWVAIQEGGNGNSCWFNLATGVVGSRDALRWISSGIQDVGNGWYRCWGLCSSTTSNQMYVHVAESDNTLTCTSPGNIYIWGAQVEYVTTETSPGTYLPTTTAAVHGPRFDYDPVTHVAKGLLIEEARTNLATQTQDFANAAWTALGTTVTANQTTAPDGTTTADLLTATASTNQTYFLSAIVTGTVYVQSVYAKKGTTDWLLFAANDGSTGAGVWFNLATGTVGTTLPGAGSVSGSIQSVGNGWYRCFVTRTGTSASASEFIQIVIANADNSLTATVGNTIYVWGAQLEAGTFASSYIPTTTGTVTRSADVAVMTGTDFSSWYNQPAGTFIAEFTPRAWPSANFAIIQADSGTAAETVRFINASGNLNLRIDRASATQAIFTFGALTANTTYKAGLSFALNDVAGCLNGGTVQTDVAALMPTPTQLRIGVDVASNYFIGHIRRIQFWNTAKSDAELVTITDPAYVEPPVEPPASSGSGLVGSGTLGAYWAQDDDRSQLGSRKRRRKFLEDRVRRVREL